jgi:pyruvate dehydrogenase E2 component (dihydrolipoamide acetyltransferase)
MATAIQMPSLSPTMEAGSIAKWLVAVGDKIEEGTPLCAVETDKTTVEYESLDEGFLREIIVDAGAEAKVNELIAVITDTADEDYAEALEQIKKDIEEEFGTDAPAPVVAPSAPVVAPSVPVEAVSAPVAPAAAPVAVASVPVLTAPVAAVAQTATAAVLNSGPVKASPLARKIAEAKGINLSEIQGTGPGGRILQGDVLGFTPSAASVGAAKARKPSPADLPATYGSLAPQTATHDVPMSGMQKVVGQRLLQSQSAAPEFFVSMKIQVDELNAIRANLNKTPGYRISVNDMIIKASAMALRQIPLVNAALVGDAIRYNQNIDISVAVAIDGGLITPIVTSPDLKPLGLISVEAKALFSKARKGTLAPHEFQGGTFTISNMGMFGVSAFTSIINAPQSAILAIAGVEEVLYRTESGEIASKNEMTVTLTSDHRVINGAVAAQFVNALKSILENPASLML